MDSLLSRTRYRDFVDAVVAAVCSSPGHSSPRARAALARGSANGDVPEPVAGFVAKVRQHAYRVTDEDVEQLKRQGLDEDEIFELTTATALGAALHRLERGMAALGERN